MITPCSIIYWPGYGGHFLSFCLSLSPETVPYLNEDFKNYNKSQLDIIKNYTAQQRKEIINYQSVTDYLRFHKKINFYEPDIYYENTLINHGYKWTILSNHPNHFEQRRSWVKKIFYVELDVEKYRDWLAWSKEKFKFPFEIYDELSDEDQKLEKDFLNNPLTTIVSMTAILDSTDGFVNEYLKMCGILLLTPETDTAIEYYKEWYALRVAGFIDA